MGCCFEHVHLPPLDWNAGLAVPPQTVEVAELPIADSPVNFEIHVYASPHHVFI